MKEKHLLMGAPPDAATTHDGEQAEVLPLVKLAKSPQPFQSCSKAAPTYACNIWASVGSRVQGPSFEWFF